jgi:hypothetical protein
MNIYRNTILTLCFTLLTIAAFAQGAPPATPIDGGLTVLLAAGTLYGVKKIRDSRSNKG